MSAAAPAAAYGTRREQSYTRASGRSTEAFESTATTLTSASELSTKNERNFDICTPRRKLECASELVMRIVGLWLWLAIPARLCAQGSYLSYSTYLGGDGEDIVHAVATDLTGNVYLAGETTSSNFPVTAGAFQPRRGNSAGTIFGFEGQFLPNAFVAKLSPAGQILWATYLGGSGSDAALGIAVDGKGSPYALG